ncbi:hypothetical protein [Ideonella sp.]|uniref:hypothetical protein n=1 Tax=Ideonella sp. TaxID=1929293 RepID=UPI0035B42FA3
MTHSPTSTSRRGLIGSLVLTPTVLAGSQAAAAAPGAGETKDRPASPLLDLAAFQPAGATVSDDAGAFNAAVLQLAQRGGGVLLVPPRVYTIRRPIYLPSGVVIDLCGATLDGAGDGVIFESGFLKDGSVVSNIGTQNESHRVIGARVSNGTIANCERAFNLFNFNENSAIRNMRFRDCAYAIYSERPFYSSYNDLTSRGGAKGAKNAAYYFKDFTNICDIANVRVIGRALGFEFSGGVNGQQIVGCSAENCGDGIRFTGEVNPISIQSCYFEEIPGVAIDFMKAVAHRAVVIDANWFQNVGTGIAGVQMLGGCIGGGNYFLKTATPVAVQDNPSTIRVEIKGDRLREGAGVALPAGYRLGSAVEIDYLAHALDSSSGRSLAKQYYSGQSPMPMPFSGNMGFVPGGIPFCSHRATGGNGFSVEIDTRIVFNDYVAALFALTIGDKQGQHVLHGRVFGSAVYADSAAGKSIRASNAEGYLRLTIGPFAGSSSDYKLEGVVRHA